MEPQSPNTEPINTNSNPGAFGQSAPTDHSTQPSTQNSHPVHNSPQTTHNQQPVVEAPIPNPGATHSSLASQNNTQVNHNYQSNPFLVTITGLIDIIKPNPGASLLVAIACIPLIILAIFGMVIVSKLVPILSILIGLAGFLLFLPFLTGAYSALAVSSMRGEKIKTMEAYKVSVSKIMTTTGVVILSFLIILVGLILFIVPGIIFAAWFSLATLAVFDEDLGAIAAMKRSKELVSGHVMEIIGAVFASSLIGGGSSSGGGLLTPIIGFAPLVGRYKQLKDLKTSGAPKPPVHWLNYLVVVLVAALFVIFVPLVIMSSKNTQDRLNDYNQIDSSNSFDDTDLDIQTN